MLLERLERSLCLSVTQSRKHIQMDGFHLFIDEQSDALYLSLAVPTRSKNWFSSVELMKQTFAEHARTARLEYIHELHTDLAAVLEEAGFKKAMQAPVMTLLRQDLNQRGFEKQGQYRRLEHHDKDALVKALRHQSLAYGGDGGDGALVWFESMLAGLKNNTLMVAVLEKEGVFVSGASIQIGGDVGELAGVWTLPREQKKGFAFECCHQLLRDYFAAGYELCWLSAAEGAQRLYDKLGFRNAGTQLNYELVS